MGTKKKLPEIFFSNAHMIAFLKYKQNLKLIGENFYYSLVIIFRSSVIIKKTLKNEKKTTCKTFGNVYSKVFQKRMQSLKMIEQTFFSFTA